MQDRIISKAAIKLNLPKNYIWKVYKSYWNFIRNHIASLPLKEDITLDEFSNLRTNINVPSLGKFHLEWDRLQQKKRKANERIKNKKDKTSVYNSNNNS